MLILLWENLKEIISNEYLVSAPSAYDLKQIIEMTYTKEEGRTIRNHEIKNPEQH